MDPIQILMQPTLEISVFCGFFNCSFVGKILTYLASLPVFCFSSWGHSSSGVTLHSQCVSGLIKVEGSGRLLLGCPAAAPPPRLSPLPNKLRDTAAGLFYDNLTRHLQACFILVKERNLKPDFFLSFLFTY